MLITFSRTTQNSSTHFILAEFNLICRNVKFPFAKIPIDPKTDEIFDVLRDGVILWSALCFYSCLYEKQICKHFNTTWKRSSLLRVHCQNQHDRFPNARKQPAYYRECRPSWHCSYKHRCNWSWCWNCKFLKCFRLTFIKAPHLILGLLWQLVAVRCLLQIALPL